MPQRAPSPPVGTVFGFATRFLYDETPTGRFSALKIIGVNTFGQAVAAALDLVADQMPTLERASRVEVLACHRFSFQGKPAVMGVQPPTREDEAMLTHLGVVSPTDEESLMAERCMSMSVIATVCAEAELEWRWRHDPDGLIEHVERRRRERDRAARSVAALRSAELSLELLASETAFTRWTPSPPFPTPAFRDAASDRVRKMARALIGMGKEIDESVVRAVLEEGIAWFNRADAEAGHPIETEEREDIARAFEELATAAGHPNAASVLDARTW